MRCLDRLELFPQKPLLLRIYLISGLNGVPGIFFLNHITV